MNRVEELEQLAKEQEWTRHICKDLMNLQEQGVHVSEIMNNFIKDKGDKTMENCGDKQRAEGQVTQELSEAENAASRLTVKVDEIETQLSSVLQETIPPSPEVETKLERSLVPLALRINAHLKVLQYLGTRLGEMRDRLELR